MCLGLAMVTTLQSLAIHISKQNIIAKTPYLQKTVHSSIHPSIQPINPPVILVLNRPPLDLRRTTHSLLPLPLPSPDYLALPFGIVEIWLHDRKGEIQALAIVGGGIESMCISHRGEDIDCSTLRVNTVVGYVFFFFSSWKGDSLIYPKIVGRHGKPSGI